MVSEILTLGINWVRLSDCVPVAMSGERFICLVPARRHLIGGTITYHVEVIEAIGGGWANGNGFSIEDCVAWCHEADIHYAAVRVFGDPESEAE